MKRFLLLGLAGAAVYALVRLEPRRKLQGWLKHTCGICTGYYSWRGFQHFRTCPLWKDWD